MQEELYTLKRQVAQLEKENVGLKNENSALKRKLESSEAPPPKMLKASQLPQTQEKWIAKRKGLLDSPAAILDTIDYLIFQKLPRTSLSRPIQSPQEDMAFLDSLGRWAAKEDTEIHFLNRLAPFRKLIFVACCIYLRQSQTRRSEVDKLQQRLLGINRGTRQLTRIRKQTLTAIRLVDTLWNTNLKHLGAEAPLTCGFKLGFYQDDLIDDVTKNMTAFEAPREPLETIPWLIPVLVNILRPVWSLRAICDCFEIANPKSYADSLRSWQRFLRLNRNRQLAKLSDLSNLSTPPLRPPLATPEPAPATSQALVDPQASTRITPLVTGQADTLEPAEGQASATRPVPSDSSAPLSLATRQADTLEPAEGQASATSHAPDPLAEMGFDFGEIPEVEISYAELASCYDYLAGLETATIPQTTHFV